MTEYFWFVNQKRHLRLWETPIDLLSCLRKLVSSEYNHCSRRKHTYQYRFLGGKLKAVMRSAAVENSPAFRKHTVLFLVLNQDHALK